MTAGRDADGAQTIRLWNPRTGQPIGRPADDPAPSYEMAFSPDGTMLATAGARTIRLRAVTYRG